MNLDNLIKACFLLGNVFFQFNHAIHKLKTISYFLNQKPSLIGSSKIIGAQNHFPISFVKALVCNKVLKVRNLPTPQNPNL